MKTKKENKIKSSKCGTKTCKRCCTTYDFNSNDIGTITTNMLEQKDKLVSSNHIEKEKLLFLDIDVYYDLFDRFEMTVQEKLFVHVCPFCQYRKDYKNESIVKSKKITQVKKYYTDDCRYLYEVDVSTNKSTTYYRYTHRAFLRV